MQMEERSLLRSSQTCVVRRLDLGFCRWGGQPALWQEGHAAVVLLVTSKFSYAVAFAATSGPIQRGSVTADRQKRQRKFRQGLFHRCCSEPVAADDGAMRHDSERQQPHEDKAPEAYLKRNVVRALVCHALRRCSAQGFCQEHGGGSRWQHTNVRCQILAGPAKGKLFKQILLRH